MKQGIIKSLDKIQERLQAEGYDVTATVRLHPKELLLIVITLKDDDAEQILNQWPKVRQIEGG